MAPNTDPWPPATSGRGDGTAGDQPDEQPDDRPAWLASGQGATGKTTTILESPRLPGGYDSTSGWSYQSSPEAERPWEQNPRTWGEPAAERTVPLRGAPWEAPDTPDRDERPSRWRRGLALAVAGLVLIAAGYGASSLTRPDTAAEPGAGVPPPPRAAPARSSPRPPPPTSRSPPSPRRSSPRSSAWRPAAASAPASSTTPAATS